MPTLSEGGYMAVRCVGCGLLFVSPRPDPAQIRRIYEHDEAQTASRQQIAKARSPEALAHAQHTLVLLRAHGARGRLVEIGPGAGLFLAEARAAGFTVTGVEPNPVQAEFIEAEFGIVCHPALPANPVDVIYHCNVLSHFYDPIATFQQLHAALDPAGLLVFETGNYADVEARFYPLITKTERFQLPDHLCFFGARSLSLLLEKTGFVQVARYDYSRVPEKLAPRVAGALGLSGWARRNRHFLKYGLGAWAPKDGRPQTWIVIAKKRDSCDSAEAGNRPCPVAQVHPGAGHG